MSTRPVNYDVVAPAYDRRYVMHTYDGIEAALRRLLPLQGLLDIVEVGCGTGHWLRLIEAAGHHCVGIDLSWGMLLRAHATSAGILLVRGSAMQLPLAASIADRIVCVNALHHFTDQRRFFAEARRVLRPGGAVLTIGLDPHAGLDSWWIYDAFPSALAADRSRYQPTAAIRRDLEESGFNHAETWVAQHIPAAVPFEQALSTGLLDRNSTSQLMVIPESEYDAGVRKLTRDRPVLSADLRLFATAAWV